VTQANRDVWRTARTLGELGELIAQWLEGRLDWSPWQRKPDPETGEITAALAALNRMGFATTHSQPGGGPDEGGWAQRAAVSGFATWELAELFEAATCMTDIVIATFETLIHVPCSIPITIWPEEVASDPDRIGVSPAYTWEGGGAGGIETLEAYEELHPEMVDVLARSAHVVLIDPSWGRKDLLWRVLEEVTPPAEV
jgi:hypothetical protein